jgi:type II secretory pathway predicted ATPase ExeA
MKYPTNSKEFHSIQKKSRRQMMIIKYYALAKYPFPKGMPSSEIFIAESQEETLTRLKYVVNNKLFATVTGDCGSGKTTVLRKLKGFLDEKKFDFLYITESQLTPRHFYNGLLSQLGRDGAFYRGDCRRILHQEIELINFVRNRNLVIAVDEAHLLSKEMLEEIRFLLNFKMDSESPLALILVGQPELEANLDKRSSMAIRQRIDFRCRLIPLNLAETTEYIQHQLRYAGSQENIFDESAIKEIYSFSGGSVRLINKVCLSCLVYGSINETKTIGEQVVKGIIECEFK